MNDRRNTSLRATNLSGIDIVDDGMSYYDEVEDTLLDTPSGKREGVVQARDDSDGGTPRGHRLRGTHGQARRPVHGEGAAQEFGLASSRIAVMVCDQFPRFVSLFNDLFFFHGTNDVVEGGARVRSRISFRPTLLIAKRTRESDLANPRR